MTWRRSARSSERRSARSEGPRSGALGAPIGSQGSDGFEYCPAVADWNHADLLQVLLRQSREDLLVNLVFAEGRLVSFETEAPQPASEVHAPVPKPSEEA